MLIKNIHAYSKAMLSARAVLDYLDNEHYLKVLIL
jgi:hypothetical protein